MIGLILGLLLLQESDADLLKRLQPLADRAGDLDPFVRAATAEEAAKAYAERGAAIDALAKAKKAPAMIVAALAGKLEPALLLKLPDKNARRAGYDLITPGKDQIPELVRQTESKDLGLRIAAARALGRVDDPALQQTISAAFGHGMRRAASADQVFSLVTAIWRGNANTYQFFIGDLDPERAGLSIAALCSVPALSLTDGFAPPMQRALENDKIDRGLRSLLIRVAGRRSPSVLLPQLSIRDRRFRSEMVEVLDLALLDPLLSPEVVEAWKDASVKKLEDGRTPGRPLTAWLEEWLTRLCGGGVTPVNFPNWFASNYRTLLEVQVDLAIEKGVQALQGSESRGICGALAAYALMKCDVSPADESVARLLGPLLDREPDGIYAASLAAMAIATALEKDAPRKEKLQRRLQRLADMLCASQTTSGGWSYRVLTWAGEAPPGGGCDLSNTQFAILGLRAAANGGAKVPRKTWERALALLEKAQNPDGGWSYSAGDRASYGRMTAAGAYSWIICRLSLDEKLTPGAALQSERMRDGIAWLARSSEKTQIASHPDYYMLYSLERLCMIAGMEKLGGRDWYAEGASLLLRSQTAGGLWTGSYGSAIDTCMALLFLKRAFIARPDIPTESAARKATPEQAGAVFERRAEALFVEGVQEIRVGQDARTSFILVVAASPEDAARLASLLGRELDGVPLRVETVRD